MLDRAFMDLSVGVIRSDELPGHIVGEGPLPLTGSGHIVGEGPLPLTGSETVRTQCSCITDSYDIYTHWELAGACFYL